MTEAKVYRNEPMIVSVKVTTDKVCITDPCYIVNNDGDDCVYDQIVGKKNWNDCILGNKQIGIIGVVRGTMYGDGSFNGSLKTEDSELTSYYHVDSGTLAMCDYHKCDEDNIYFDESTIIQLDEFREHELAMVHLNGTIGFYVDGKNVETIYTGKRKTRLPKKLSNVKL